jgi:hypothetical protein
MNTPSIKLLHQRLYQDAGEIMHVASQQVDSLSSDDLLGVIRIADKYFGIYPYAPHALLFDMWAGRAELRLLHEWLATLRFLRADMTFRRWEKGIESEGIRLTEPQLALIGTLMFDFYDTLCWVRQSCDYNGMIDLLCDEYEHRLIWRSS